MQAAGVAYKPQPDNTVLDILDKFAAGPTTTHYKFNADGDCQIQLRWQPEAWRDVTSAPVTDLTSTLTLQNCAVSSAIAGVGALSSSLAEIGWLNSPRSASNSSLVALKAQLLNKGNYAAWVSALKPEKGLNGVGSWRVKKYAPVYSAANASFREWVKFPRKDVSTEVDRLDTAIPALRQTWPNCKDTAPNQAELPAVKKVRLDNLKTQWASASTNGYGNMLEAYVDAASTLRGKYSVVCKDALDNAVSALAKLQNPTNAQITAALKTKTAGGLVKATITRTGDCEIKLAWTPAMWL